MAVFPERRASNAAIWSQRLATFSAVLLVLAAVSHRYGLLETVSFFWVLGLVGALVIAAVALASMGLYRLWTFGERAGRTATRGLIIALIVASPFLVSAYRAFANPRLHEVSTDLADPPAMPIAAASRSALMNAIGSIPAGDAEWQRNSLPGLAGRRYALSADRVLEIAERLIEQRGWQMRAVPEVGELVAATTVEAEAWSPIVALPADVALRVMPDGDTTVVDMRSSSRFGLHDFGDNAARISSFLGDLDGAVAEIALPSAADAE